MIFMIRLSVILAFDDYKTISDVQKYQICTGNIITYLEQYKLLLFNSCYNY